MSSEFTRESYSRFINKKIFFILFLIIFILLIAGISATLGSYNISISEVYSILLSGIFQTPETTEELVIWNLRLPRILMAIFAGIGLAAAGAVMQAILKNPLASPFTLGIASAATFGASMAIILGAGIIGGSYLVVGNAFFFCLLAAFLVYGLAYFKGFTPETIILAGIGIMYLFSSLTSFLQYTGSSENIQEVVFWMLGSLGKASWDTVLIVVVVLFCCLPYLFLKSVDFNVMSAGDDSAKSVGVNVERVRITGMILSSLITASIICFTGTIGFIGLVAPHMTRMIIGGDNRFLLPASCIMGALLLLGADTLSRTLLSPVIIPIGVMTAFIGVPFFFFLFMKRRRSNW